MTTNAVRTNALVYLGLLVLLAVTVFAATLDLGAFGVFLAMVIGAAKAALIVLYFMHVKSGPRLTWLAVSAGFFWLTVMLLLVLADYFTRPMLGWPIFVN